jgi:aryl-alcohol dehydrogenase-like predicted oxidoreductase
MTPTTWSRLALGSWHTWDRMTHDEGVELFRAAVAGGARLFDVGSYNMGPHEEGSETDVLFGTLARASGLERESWQLCFKLWLWTWPAEPLAVQLDRLIERTGFGHAELAILGDFVGELDVERVVGEVGALLGDGRVGAWGVNNWSAQDIARADDAARAAGIAGPALAQLKYSVCRRSVAEGAPWRALIDERGIAIQASDVFEGGILAGGAADGRRIGMDTGGVRERIRAAAPALAATARDFGATPGQLALAFCLANPDVASVLFGVSRRAQLDDNLGALQLAAEHGPALRAAVADHWLDRGVVDPARPAAPVSPWTPRPRGATGATRSRSGGRRWCTTPRRCTRRPSRTPSRCATARAWPPTSTGPSGCTAARPPS